MASVKVANNTSPASSSTWNGVLPHPAIKQWTVNNDSRSCNPTVGSYAASVCAAGPFLAGQRRLQLFIHDRQWAVDRARIRCAGARGPSALASGAGLREAWRDLPS